MELALLGRSGIAPCGPGWGDGFMSHEDKYSGWAFLYETFRLAAVLLATLDSGGQAVGG